MHALIFYFCVTTMTSALKHCNVPEVLSDDIGGKYIYILYTGHVLPKGQ